MILIEQTPGKPVVQHPEIDDTTYSYTKLVGINRNRFPISTLLLMEQSTFLLFSLDCHILLIPFASYSFYQIGRESMRYDLLKKLNERRYMK